ncbi:MAG: glycosyltransferase [Desulfovibrionaceae bacterium]|nr:glycosyltransferase [Desulfovibrionaceae bacterium]
MRTFFFIPPLNKMSGGLAVICRIAEILHQAGHEAALVVREQDPLQHAVKAPVIDWKNLALTGKDLWVVPEGWPNALLPGLQAGAHNLVYVQNWAYLFSALPEGLDWNRLSVEFLAVSTPVAYFIWECLGKEADILRPGIDLSHFRPDSQAGNSLLFGKQESLIKNSGKAGRITPPRLKKINVAWMPRKNRAIAIQAMQIFEGRGRAALPVNWVEIQGRGHEQVAAMLQMSHIFMGAGFPEGFGLPPLEAMACGAVPVTCAGAGGWDYLRQALPPAPEMQNISSLTPPAYYLKPGRFGECDLPAGPNAFVVPDADPISLAIAVEKAVNLIAAGDPLIGEMLLNGQQTAQALSLEKQRENVLRLWERFCREIR